MNYIGRRLRYFRERAGISQMNLELEIGAAFGSISRMESGQINPTKETIRKIAGALKLRDRELSYIIGVTAFPVTQDEILQAQNEVKNYFSQKNILAYLVEDRFRVLAFSKGFEDFFKISDQQILNNISGKTLLELLLNPDLNIRQYFEGDSFEQTVMVLVPRFYSEMGFMLDDEYFIRSLDWIKKDPLCNKIWDDLISKPHEQEYFVDRKRIVTFNIGKFKFGMRFENEPLHFNKRFDIVEYLPTNKVLKLLMNKLHI